MIVLSWYMFIETENIFWVGVFNACYFLPNIFSFLLGDLIDRSNKKKLLIILELGQLTAILIIILTAMVNFNPVVICVCVFFASLFGMNTYTVQDTLIPKIVKKKELDVAQSYMSVGYKTIDNVFNALVGLMIKYISMISLLSVSVVSFFLSILTFRKIKYVEQEKKEDTKIPKEKHGFKEGFRIIFNDNKLLTITINLTLVNFFFGGFNVFIVKIAGNMNSPIMLGLLNTSVAMGTLVGATFFAHKVLKPFNLGRKLVYCSFLFGGMLLVTSLFVDSILLLIFLLISCTFLGVTQILTHPIVQSITPENKLGKVFSAQYSISVGIMPFGAFFFGKMAEFIDPSIYFTFLGATYIVIGISYLIQKEILNFSLSAEQPSSEEISL